jgi:uncharacterized membrane protein YidH (DUF202 family)
MLKAIGVALLAGGILLLVFGINAYNSTGSDISRFFTGTATDRSTWMLVGGTAIAILGIFGLLQRPKHF